LQLPPNSLLFPGLINSHDHLDFNLFPALGNRVYANYRDWGRDIHHRNRSEIDAVLKVPKPLRTRWGIYKNLLNGFTTVVNHGDPLDTGPELITVFQDYPCLHSVGFEKNWRWKLNRHFRARSPFVVHVGEGTDRQAHAEISRLIRWNFFKNDLIGIHGVAMDDRQATAFRALIWCPASNRYLLDRTAPADTLKRSTTLLFGTDSTLTAPWNAWDQIRMAREEAKLTDGELLDALTISAARIWGLTCTGELAPGKDADLVIARPRGSGQTQTATFEDFFSLGPEDIQLVMQKGQIRLFDASLGDLSRQGFQTVKVGEKEKYVQGDINGLMQEIGEYYPSYSTKGTCSPLFFR
jgi:cytosine/adenosine deaminase-related metal-dependent hydrolase